MEPFARSVGPLWEQEPYWLAEEFRALADAGLKVAYVQVSASRACTPSPPDGLNKPTIRSAWDGIYALLSFMTSLQWHAPAWQAGA